MTGKVRWVVLLVLACGVSARSVHAQSTVLVTAAGFESDLVAPNVLLIFGPDPSPGSASAGRTWTLGLRGSTLSAQVLTPRSRRVTLLVGADLAPLRANASSRIYRNGQRASELEFSDGSYQGRAGLRVQSGHSRIDVSALALKESIRGPVDEATRSFWNRPYGGIGIAESLRFARSEDPIRSRFEGVKVTASGQRFFGDETWWRGQLTVDGGAWLGRLFVRGRATAFDGRGLNIVNRFLVGGSWDVDEGVPVYGFRYGEFRLARGAVLGGGADLRVWRGLEIGVRGSDMSSRGLAARGAAVRVSTVWNGCNLDVGVGLPGGTAANGHVGTFVFGAITAAFVK